MSNAREKEMARLYLEAVSLVIKLSNKIKEAELEDAELHLQASKEFLERNELYEAGVRGLL